MNKQQLAAKIWESANRMRGKVDASEYKDFILGFIFYKYLSEKEEQFFLGEGMTAADMEQLVEEDEETVGYAQNHLGYFISYQNLFSTWIQAGNDFAVSQVYEALSAFSRLVSPLYKNVFDGIFITLQTGLSKLGDNTGSQTKAVRDLVHLIQTIPMSTHQDYDVLGYIYEDLISKFASNAGKKAGEFYTPHEVSVLMADIVAHHLRSQDTIRIYDPTSGSGSLLITIGDAVKRRMGDADGIAYYAQELNQSTYNLTRMNLVMRGIKPSNITVRNGDTLEDDWPYFDDSDPSGTYDPLYVDAVVSNPPYSQRWEPEGKENDIRFAYGVAPRSKADYAFLLHDLYHLKPSGIMCIVLPHGVLFRGGRGGSDPSQPHRERQDRRHHRATGQHLLRNGHPHHHHGVTSEARRERRAHRRRLEGLRESGEEQPAALLGYPPHCRYGYGSSDDRGLLAPCGKGRDTRQRLQLEYPALRGFL